MKKALLILILPLIMLSARAAGHYTLKQWSYGGTMRQYYLYIPTSYDSTHPTPFVLALHGLGDNISNFKNIDMNLVADTANFIFAIPQALNDPLLGSSAWNSGAGEFSVTLNSNVDDVGFLNAIIDSTAAYYNLDQTRLYATGFSMGGFMANRLGCELNNRIAAIASVSGTIGTYLNCQPTRVVPACHFHGTNDQVVYYTGDMFGNDPEQLVAYWRQHDGCDSTPIIDTLPNAVPDTLTFIHYTYPNGRYGSDVEFYKVINGTHEWIWNQNLNYSVAIWQFFSKHSWVEQTTGINQIQAAAQLSIYPNPASTVLNITLPQTTQSPAQLMVTDLTGRTLIQQPVAVGQSNQQIYTSNLPAGAYICTLQNTTGNTLARAMFVVQQ
ncbi:MAG TPA: T9SS type A sorting domain-containing protein [Chitinophagales bacterium]|nr:T9SS type A sorting domain-containing protein [Chitinophagales bacterium]